MTQPAASRAEFFVLGPLAVVRDGRAASLGGGRQMAVLARLLMDAGSVVPMDDLVDGVWDGDEPSRPEATVRSYLSHLRRAVDPARGRDRQSVIERCPPGYRLAIDATQVDAAGFEAEIDEGRRALARGDHACAIVHLDAALTRWRGVPYGGVPDTAPVLAARARLEELRLGAVEALAEARLACGEHETVAQLVQADLGAHPLRERLTELTMLALYRAGRQSEALAACRRLRGALLDRLGVDPSPAVQDLERRILSHAEDLRAPTDAQPGPAPAAAANGVRPEAVAPTDGVLDALRQHRSIAVAVTGEPGSGKSAVVGDLAAAVAVGLPGGVDAPRPTTVVARSRRTVGSRRLWLWAQVLDRLAEAHERQAPSGPPETLDLSQVAEGLRMATAAGPVVVIIEDCQWADAASIDGVHHVIEELANLPIAVVVTWRHTDPADPETLQALRRLSRLPALVRVELGGLDRPTVERLVAAADLGAASTGIDVHGATAGNPTYVTELLVGLDGSDDHGTTFDAETRWPLTTNLRELIRARVDDVHPETTEVLTLAAVVGGPFAAGLLAAAGDLPLPLVEDVLERSSAGGLLVGVPDTNDFEFVHPVVAAALRDDVSPPRRARLHNRIGHALWRAGAPPLAIARHLGRARSANASVLAARFALEAAAASPGVDAAVDPHGELATIVAAALPAFAFVPGAEEQEARARRFLDETLAAPPRPDPPADEGGQRGPTSPQSFLNRAEAS